MIYWYVGPWQKRKHRVIDAWCGPVGTRAAIDFRGDIDGNAPGVGVFACESPVADSSYELIGEGDWADIKPNARTKAKLPKRRLRPLQGENLYQLLLDSLTSGADPTGEEFAKPIMPTVSLQVELACAGLFTRVPYRPDAIYASAVRDVIRKQLSDAHDANPELARKVLDYERQKYKLGDDWQSLVPERLKNVLVPGKHETTITDNFNRSNSTTLGTSSDGTFSWTETLNDLEINTNALRAVSDNKIDEARAELSLSGADHYSQVKVTISGATGANDVAWAPLVRFSPSARTYYSGELYEGSGPDQVYLLKTNAGSRTLVSGPTTVTNAINDLWRLTINGSSLGFTQNGTSRISSTDTSITGNLRTGVFLLRQSSDIVAADDFEASDLAAGILYTQLEHGVRGLNRGVYTGGL